MIEIGKIYVISKNKRTKMDVNIDECKIKKEYEKLNESWKKLAKRGYTVVSNCYDYYSEGKNAPTIDYEKTKNAVFIAPEISKKEAKLLEKTVFALPKNDRIDLYNFFKNKYGQIDYAYYDARTNKYKGDNKVKKSSNIVKYFINEKIDKLNNEEKKMMDKYYRFNMEGILYTDTTNYPLNNSNSGIISIFSDRIYKTSVTKERHSEELSMHKVMHLKETGVVEEPIYFQLNKGNIMCWLGQDINDYQAEKLEKICEKIKSLEVRRGEVYFAASILNKDDIVASFENPNDLENYISDLMRQKNKMVI